MLFLKYCFMIVKDLFYNYLKDVEVINVLHVCYKLFKFYEIYTTINSVRYGATTVKYPKYFNEFDYDLTEPINVTHIHRIQIVILIKVRIITASNFNTFSIIYLI